MDSKIEISVVATIYNSASTVQTLVNEIQTALLGVASYEIILVDDRSSDQSWSAIKTCSNPNLIAVRLSRNFGQHTAITAGIHKAKGNYVVLMDGDLQDSPADIPKLYQKIKNSNSQIVYVKRKNRKAKGWKIWTGKLFYKIFQQISGIKSDNQVGTYRIFTAKVAQAFNSFTEKNKFVGGLFYWMGFESDYLELESKARLEGKSSYNIGKLIRLAAKGIVSFSNKPLNFAIYLGLISSILAFLFGLYFLFVKLFLNSTISGYFSIIITLFFLGGLILFVLGILGQYIGQIYEQVKNRPEYFIDEEFISE